MSSQPAQDTPASEMAPAASGSTADGRGNARTGDQMASTLRPRHQSSADCDALGRVGSAPVMPVSGVRTNSTLIIGPGAKTRGSNIQRHMNDAAHAMALPAIVGKLTFQDVANYNELLMQKHKELGQKHEHLTRRFKVVYALASRSRGNAYDRCVRYPHRPTRDGEQSLACPLPPFASFCCFQFRFLTYALVVVPKRCGVDK